MSTFLAALLKPLPIALVGIAIALFGADRRPRLRTVVGALSLPLVLVPSLPVTAHALLGSLERRFPIEATSDLPTADAIVFLAGATETALPPRIEPELGSRGDRLLVAARLLRREKAPLLIISGGSGAGPSDAIRDPDLAILSEWGVDPRQVVTERASRDTRDSAAALVPLLRRLRIESILLVTSAYHMPRAMMLFGEVVPSVTPVTANHLARSAPDGARISNWIPSALSLAGSALALHEYLGMLEITLRARIP